mmetsp:Transcript_8972/g.8327  ORF Transcript_8972/g.8327 Transcript_8972/m.8327 type:complete len:190 (+) Transcript_8972:2977-3546(+)
MDEKDDSEDIVNFEDNNLEEENEKLIMNLKKAKIDLAVFQERSSSTELKLKKEIFKLQVQLAQNFQDSPNQNDMSPSTAPQCFQSFQKNEIPFTHQPFTPPSITINKNTVTPQNFGSRNMSSKTNFVFGKEDSANPFSSKKLQQIPKKDLCFQASMTKNCSLDMKTPLKKDLSESFLSMSENLDSPTLQ